MGRSTRQILLLVAIFTVLTLASPDFDSDVSRRMRTYSLIAHCSEDQIVNWHCKLCSQTERLQELEYIENKVTSIMVFAGYMKSIDRIIFVFRGTINATNWVEDFTFIQAPYKRCANCKVHQGFYLSYLSLADQIQTSLKTLTEKYPGKEVVMTGASLGAGVATIAAIELITQDQSIAELHTWGSPRVGNLNFAMFVKKRVPIAVRVVHNRDIVPHLPLMSQNYHHLPYEILFDQEMMNHRRCDQSGEDLTCSDSYYPNLSIQDHLTYWIRLDVEEICAE